MTTGSKTYNRVLSYVDDGRLTTSSGLITGTNPVVGNINILQGRTWNGDNDPMWKLKVLNRQDATNKYEVTHYLGVGQLEYPEHYVWGYFSNNSSYRLIRHNRPPVPVFTLPWVSPAELAVVSNEAKMKFQKHLRLTAHDVDGLSFIGELRETISMIRRPAEALAKLIESHAAVVRHNKWIHQRDIARIKQRPASTAKQLANRARAIKRRNADARKLYSRLHLQFNYGVKPLAGDIASSAGLLVAIANNEVRIPFKVVTGKAEFTDKKVSGGLITEGYFTVNRTTNERRTTKVRYVGMVDLKQYYSGQSDLRMIVHRAGLSQAADIIPALWDLSPLTVFVDMFANISDVLAAHCVSVPVVNNHRIEITETIVAEGNVISLKPTLARVLSVLKEPKAGYCSISKKRYRREKQVMSLPTLAFSSPLSLSSNQISNLAAFVNNVI